MFPNVILSNGYFYTKKEAIFIYHPSFHKFIHKNPLFYHINTGKGVIFMCIIQLYIYDL